MWCDGDGINEDPKSKDPLMARSAEETVWKNNWELRKEKFRFFNGGGTLKYHRTILLSVKGSGKHARRKSWGEVLGVLVVFFRNSNWVSDDNGTGQYFLMHRTGVVARHGVWHQKWLCQRTRRDNLNTWIFYTVHTATAKNPTQNVLENASLRASGGVGVGGYGGFFYSNWIRLRVWCPNI